MEAKTHEQMDAILMSLSALAVMANLRYGCWRMSTIASRSQQLEKQYREMHAEMEIDHAKVLQELCSKINDAMQYIGDANNNCDIADEHGMTDAAFAAMDRALARKAGE